MEGTYFNSIFFILICLESARTLETLSCGGQSNASEFLFTSPGYPESIPEESMDCSFSIDHDECSSWEAEHLQQNQMDHICQLRIDFEDFQLQPPEGNECKHDIFFTEHSEPLPRLCGNNAGTHMYVNVEGRSRTRLTFLLNDVERGLYNCRNYYGVQINQSLVGEPSFRQLQSSSSEPTSSDSTAETTPSSSSDSTAETTSSSSSSDSTAETTSSSSSSSDSTAETTTTYPTVAIFDNEDFPIVELPTRRAWKLKVTQIPCSCSTNKAPGGCLQYFSGVKGTVKSFNFGTLGCVKEDSLCDWNREPTCDAAVGLNGQLKNIDYSICIEPEDGFCGIEYNQVSSSSQLQAGEVSCGSGFLMIPGALSGGEEADRFCALGEQVVQTFTKPFVLRNHINDQIGTSNFATEGFQIAYNQVPCISAG